MALISASQGILRSQEIKAFIDRLQKSINSRISCMEGEEALAFLYDIKRNLVAEESAVNRSNCTIEELVNRLESAGSEEFELLTGSFHRLAAEQFSNRASVSTFHACYAKFFELLIFRAIATAAAMLKSEGLDLQGKSWCALASGELGRGEPSRRFLGQIILLAEDAEGFSRELFNLFAYRVLAILEPLITSGEKQSGSGRRQFWSGSVTEWLEFIDAGLHGRKNSPASSDTLADEDLFAETFRMVADLRPLCGVIPLAETVIASSRRRVAIELDGERFWHFARRTAAMPVAIGFFGRFKTVKTGKHRGKLPLKELTLNPLIAATRALAVSYGITETSTVARIKQIIATGNLGVTLADRLLIAYHDLMKTLIELELADNSGNERIFLDPDTLDEQSRERFRIAVEDITTLQRIAHQHLVEVD